MNAIIVMPDAMAVTIEYLTDQFSDVGETATIHSRIPEPRPETFVTVLRTGGINQTIVSDGAQLTIEAWGEDDETAMTLAQLARALLHAMRGTVQGDVTVYGVNEFSGPSLLADPLSGQARATFTVQVGMRGTVLAPLGS